MEFSSVRELLFSQVREKTNILAEPRITFREVHQDENYSEKCNSRRFCQRIVILAQFSYENWGKLKRELSFSLLELSNSLLNIVILSLIRGEKRANSRYHNCIKFGDEFGDH